MKLYIIGNGKMAKALIYGLYKNYKIEVVGRDIKKLESLKEKIDIDISLLDDFDITNKHIILAVKPNALDEVSLKLNGKAMCIYSILAGVTIAQIQVSIESNHYIRVMPNLAAIFRNSITAITGDIEFKDEAEKIFSSIGKVVWVNSEKELDISTAVAGSGPAFLALVAEAIEDGAVANGLSREVAREMTKGLFNSYAILSEHYSPSVIKDNVMSPGGTTASGYAALERGAVRFNFIEAITSAYKRALSIAKR